tara:strand:- start:490 stop:984 length:495 start_codon:yes stop_codon:yes gene_type:complete
MKDIQFFSGVTDAAQSRFAVIVSVYHRVITEALCIGAVETLRQAGAVPNEQGDPITIIEVPGAFEIPFAARRVADTGVYDAVICVGCIVRGETPHFEFIASAVAHGITMASQLSGVPITFGVLTTNNEKEAEERSKGDSSNKGCEAARAAIQLANVIAKLPQGK